jgi:NADH dehydrogenase FAD-containing subunit
VTSAAQILTDLRPTIAVTPEQQLSKLGVIVLKATKVVTVKPSDAGSHISYITSPVVVTLSTNTTTRADIYIPATGAHASTTFLSPSLLTHGRVATNPATLRVDSTGPRIYAIDDYSTAFRSAINNIMATVPVLGENIKNDLVGSVVEDRLLKEDMRETQLVPIGTKNVVGAAMGWKLPSWLVRIIKGRKY